MRPIYLACTALAAWAAFPLSAAVSTIRADIRSDYSSRGKCTIEVEVDDVAEVIISGDTARVRNLSGQPGNFRRMICSSPLPRNPVDFRFRGIDGRGRVNLVQDPRSGGNAVVRIEDNKGGREAYTFDLEWSGGTYDNRRDDRWGRNDDRVGRDGDWGNSGRNNGRWGNDGRWGNNNRLDFSGNGEGYFRTSRYNERLRDARVDINNNGRVRTEFSTDRGNRLSLNGRVNRVEGNRIYADMNGQGVNGSMVISVDGNDRVRDISMSGFGRDQFELRWRD